MCVWSYSVLCHWGKHSTNIHKTVGKWNVRWRTTASFRTSKKLPEGQQTSGVVFLHRSLLASYNVCMKQHNRSLCKTNMHSGRCQCARLNNCYAQYCGISTLLVLLNSSAYCVHGLLYLSSVEVSHNLQSQSLSMFALLSWMDQITLFCCCLMTFLFTEPFLYLLTLPGMENTGDLTEGCSTSTKMSWQIWFRYQANAILTFGWKVKSFWLLCLQKQKLAQHWLFLSIFSSISTTIYLTHDLKGISPRTKEDQKWKEILLHPYKQFDSILNHCL